jgi:hypothetical protein
MAWKPVVKQDRNGTTFVINAVELAWHCDVVAQTPRSDPPHWRLAPSHQSRRPRYPIPEPGGFPCTGSAASPPLWPGGPRNAVRTFNPALPAKLNQLPAPVVQPGRPCR